MGYSEQDILKGLISRIQKYSINDGPGIRTTVFFKGCSMNCDWCSNPELINSSPEILSNYQICLHCGACYEACKEEAILLDQGEYVIQTSRCTMCGQCVEVCPVGARDPIGRYYSIDELVTALMKDQIFYAVSEGGVTFSGGEPTLQHKFIVSVAQELKKNNIHLALDTSGNTPWDHIEKLYDVIDLFLYDIKFIENDKHILYTGTSNEMILTNAKKLSALDAEIIIRLVILPGLNDSAKEIADTLSFISQLDSVKQIDILPYHKFGVGKYRMLGRKFPLKDFKPPDRKTIERLKSEIESLGFRTSVGG